MSNPEPSAGTSWDPFLMTISLLAGIGFTATAEYQLALTIGAVPSVAVLLPLALDVYVVAAIRRARGRDIALSLVLMGTAQVSAHMLSAGVVAVSVPLVASVSLLVPLVIWRVHALATVAPKRSREAAPTPGTGVAPVPPVPTVDLRREPVPALAANRPELQAVPEPETDPVPVRRARSTAARSTRPKHVSRRVKAGTASFDEHVSTAIQWLAKEPELSGAAIGTRLGTGDSYGRRVRRAAIGTEGVGPEPRTADELQPQPTT